MLVNMRDLLADAEKGNYAVGSFSVANMEMVLGAVQAAEELNAPIILQIAEVRLKQSPLEIIGPLMVAAAKSAKVPVAVHFDHGKTLKKINQALEIGFTSVMFDGSHLPLDENIAMTNRVIESAKKYDAAVEAEIGCVGGSEDGSEDIAINCTKPEDAVKFESETGVDALAVAIGNAHGNYKATPKLRFDILETVDKMTKTPLVLHGGTGISPVAQKRASKKLILQPQHSTVLKIPFAIAIKTKALKAIMICRQPRLMALITMLNAIFSFSARKTKLDIKGV